MAKKLYVGNLSYSTHDEDLREAFSKIGEVTSVTLITDQATGRSKGFGFVEMASDEDAEKAIAALNGTAFMERTITVNEARPKTERSGSGGGGGTEPGQHGQALPPRRTSTPRDDLSFVGARGVSSRQRAARPVRRSAC